MIGIDINCKVGHLFIIIIFIKVKLGQCFTFPISLI